MKKFKIQLFVVLLGLSIFFSCKKNGDNVVTNTVDFENLTVGASGYWNGFDGSGGFTSSGMTFTNEYNFTYFSWQGFSYSQISDVLPPLPPTSSAIDLNQFSVFDAANGSNKFIIYYPPFGSDLYASLPVGTENIFRSVSVCNSVYAALAMRDGNLFSKKFGGESHNDKDWFKLTIIGYNAAGDSVKSVDFYLADYRFDNNSKDYIIKKWTNVDLTSLGKINKVTFRFSSSDNGIYGMNTPAYVCLDNLNYEVDTPAL